MTQDPQDPQDPQDQELRAELLRRVERDQAARQERDAEAWTQVDAENLPWLKAVLADNGWPGRSAVGADGAHAAWLLAQHADDDPVFQRQCLDLLTVAAEDGEATKSEVAYLTDRVLLAEGQPQEFGTQTIAGQHQWVPRPLRDPANVDQRRAAMSLGPLADHLVRIAADFGPPPATVISCPECGGSVEFWPGDSGQQITLDCPGCGVAIEMTISP
jgi:hypothetical protein